MKCQVFVCIINNCCVDDRHWNFVSNYCIEPVYELMINNFYSGIYMGSQAYRLT